MIETPYLLFLGDAPDHLAAKVAQGIKDWRPENAMGQLRLPGCGTNVGLSDMTLAEGRKAGAKTLGKSRKWIGMHRVVAYCFCPNNISRNFTYTAKPINQPFRNCLLASPD